MRRLALAAIAAAALVAVPATAELTKGTRAPDFTASGAMAGKPITVKLSDSLRKGPVVLYFFPAAFTGGCNIEAQAFAKAMPDFKAAGATVIGMTAGNVDKLVAFSSEHCAGQFPVAAANAKLVADYDVVLRKPDGTPSGMTSRTSYVIAPNGKVIFAHTDMSPADHIKMTLETVRAYRKGPKRR